MNQRFRLCFSLCSLLCLWACEADEEDAAVTQFIAVIDSNLATGSQLDRMDVAVSTADGKEDSFSATLMVVANGEDESSPSVVSLPYSFSIVKGTQPKLRVTVEGYGRRADGTSGLLVRTRVIATFQEGKTVVLPLRLVAECIDNFCGDDDALVCYSELRDQTPVGECGPTPELGPGLEVVRNPTKDVPPLPDAGTRLDAGTPAADAGATAAAGDGGQSQDQQGDANASGGSNNESDGGGGEATGGTNDATGGGTNDATGGGTNDATGGGTNDATGGGTNDATGGGTNGTDPTPPAPECTSGTFDLGIFGTARFGSACWGE